MCINTELATVTTIYNNVTVAVASDLILVGNFSATAQASIQKTKKPKQISLFCLIYDQIFMDLYWSAAKLPALRTSKPGCTLLVLGQLLSPLPPLLLFGGTALLMATYHLQAPPLFGYALF